MRHIQFSPGDTIIDIRRDSVFKAAFTADTPPSQGALRALISAFIGRNVQVLTVIANEPPAQDLRDRQIRYDIRVKFDRGELANVEMTLHPGGFEPLRFEYYTARLHAAQEIRGQRYGNLVPAWQINFVSARRLFPDASFFHHFEYYDPERGTGLGGRTHILVVELEKVDDLLSKPVEELSAVEGWAVFFRFAADPEWRSVINKLMSKEEGIAMAGEMLLTVTKEEIEQARRETALKIELDWESYMAEAWEKGEAKGEAAGWQKRDEKARREKLESARRLKAMGVPLNKIAAGLDLPPEEIEALEI
ncbi:MAG: Rpn family recombination-promoting nuclease/putative transposase [Treponema sp.]|nr:Rpn family recombination-promoting nuclease/putative transposase [Treponema sp.]